MYYSAMAQSRHANEEGARLVPETRWYSVQA